MIFYIRHFTSLDSLKALFVNNFQTFSSIFKLSNNYQEYLKQQKLEITEQDLLNYVYNNVVFQDEGDSFKVLINKKPEEIDIYNFINLLEYGNLSIKRENKISTFILSVLNKSELDLIMRY